MLRFLLVGSGGAIGAVLRYIVSAINYRFLSGLFPVGTFIVNISGGFVIGLVWGVIENFYISPMVRLFIMVGILGGYTTFSTFSLETFHLLRNGEFLFAVANIIGSIVLSIGAVYLGYYLISWAAGLSIKGGV